MIRKIESKHLELKASDITNQIGLVKCMYLFNEINLEYKPDQTFILPIFETIVESKMYYCSCSGINVFSNGGYSFSKFGEITSSLLLKLPSINKTKFKRHNEIPMPILVNDGVSMKRKIFKFFKQFPNEEKVCFVGDFKNELDGQIHKALNITGIKQFLF